MARFLRQPIVGHRLRVLREHARLTRAQLSQAVGISPSSLTRLENGQDVRLSVYLKVIDHFLERTPQSWMLADRIASLHEARRARLLRELGAGDG